MHPARLLLPLAFVATVLLSGPTEATLGLAAMGAILAPAALLALPGGPLLLGLGAVGLKFAIASRLLSLLCGWLHSRSNRGITLKKEFVHIPARDMAHRQPEVAIAAADLAHSPPAFPIQRAAAPALLPSHPPSPFALPYPYTAPQSTLHKAFNVQYSSPPAAVGVSKSTVPSASFFIGKHDVKHSPQSPFPPILQDNGFVVPSSGIVFTSSVPEEAPAAHQSPVALNTGKVQPATGGTFDQLLRIAQSPAVSTLVSNNPDLVVRFLQGLAGVKSRQTPIGTAHSTAGLTISRIGAGDIEALLNFVRQDPNLVRNIVKADPGFVPSLVNNIIGVSSNGQGSSPPPPPPPPPPPSFPDSTTKERPDDGANKTSSSLSADNVPANVPIDTEDPPAPRPEKVLYAKKKEASPAPVSRPAFLSGPSAPAPRPAFPSGSSAKDSRFVSAPQETYSLVGYPSTFYTVPNYQQPPLEAYGFPANIPQPLPPVFSSSPWNVASLLALFNGSHPETERVKVPVNDQNEKLNQNTQPSNELQVQRPSQRKWPGENVKTPEAPSINTHPKGSYEAPVVEEPIEENLPSRSYGVSSVEEPTDVEQPSRGYGTSRVEEPKKDTPAAGGYGIPPVEEPSHDELPAGGYGTAPVQQPGKNTRPAGGYGVPPAEEPSKEMESTEEPIKDTGPAGGYGVPPADLPSEGTSPAGGYGVGPVDPPSQEQDSGYGTPPVQPAARPSDRVSSYPIPSGDHDASSDEDVAVATSQPLGQEIPASGVASGDIYSDNSDDGGHVSGVQVTHHDQIQEAEKPPAVRPVFVPVTGKFRFEAIKKILGEASNAAGFPANLYDPVTFWAQAAKDM
ncbi:unnamed protein product [Ixodes hexagonus]